MKILKAVLVCVLLLAIVPGLVLIKGATLPEYYGESYYAELSELYSRLKNTAGPRLIVVGGSSVAFGFEGETAERLLREHGFSFTACPFGLYAAIGTAPMLELAAAQVHEGDIIILAPEPTPETLSEFFGATAYWKCAESDRSLTEPLDGAMKKALAGNYIQYLNDRLEIERTGVLPQASGVYAKSSFNSRCDLSYDRAGNAMALGFDSSAPIDLGSVRPTEGFVSLVRRLKEAAEKAGATVLLSFAPMNESAVVSSEEDAYEYYMALSRDLGLTCITDIRSCIMDPGWFYDNNFHLNSAGAVRNTYRLCVDLMTYLGTYEPIEARLPDMPESIARPVGTAGDEVFTFEAVTARGRTVGYRVSGIREEGKALTSLTVPGSHEGLPVAGYVPGAFQGAGAEELILPESIEELPQGGLAGMTGLRRLVLTGKNGVPAVNPGSFEGTEGLRVFVPKAVYVQFRDGAGCAGNGWESYLNMITAY